MSRANGILVAGALCLVLGAMALVAQEAGRPKPKRAQPRTFDPAKTEGVFFPDAFQKALSGPRPADIGRPVAATPQATPGGPSEGPAPMAAGGAWSAIVSAESLQDEVTSIKQLIDGQVTTPTAFAGGAYKDVRREFTVLGVIFNTIAEFDGEVRFKKSALVARDAFIRAGLNAKSGAQAVYNEAKLRKADLQELVGGGEIKGAAGEEKFQWDKTCRPPLMQRFDLSEKSRLLPWTSSKGEFDKHNEELLREAQIIAVIARTIKRADFEFYDDSGYLKYCDELAAAATEIAEGVKANNYDRARMGAAAVSKACSDCHNDYRSGS